jgi:hypothetical protein
MQIHQMQLKYDINADRLLLQVRTREAELYGVWLTRRMVSRLRPPFQQAVTRLGMARAAPQSMPVPEARAMLEQAVRDRPLPNADFAIPFESEGVSHPLGPEPLLPAEVDIRGLPTGGLALNLREARGRRLELPLNDQLATALLRLLDQALAGAEWGLPTATAEAPTAPSGPLN